MNRSIFKIYLYSIINKKRKLLKLLIFAFVIYILFFKNEKRPKTSNLNNFQGMKKIKILIFGKFINSVLFPEFDYKKCPNDKYFDIIRSEEPVDFDILIICHTNLYKFYDKFNITGQKKISIVFLWVKYFVIGSSVFEK